MARIRLTSTDLRRVKDEASLFALLRRLGWPLIDDDDALTYPIADVGSVSVRQLLPFAQDDPWLILLVEYQGPFRRDDVRKTLREVRKLQRQQGKYEGKGIADILFICVAQGYEEIEFVRFIERGSRQPKLRVFGWSPNTTNQNRTVCEVCLPALALETTPKGLPDWSLATWAQAWDVEKVTKEFFKGFDTLRKATHKHLKPHFGKDAEAANWATSIQLNRLLFVYFLADQGFLKGGVDRLHSALAKGGFHSWFQTLSMVALGQPGARPKDFEDVQYMNGGLFVLHETEEGRDLTLPDDHYADWLEFLGKYRWTLSENEGVNTISPHILGYLFERYINNKLMGAYYTKEDVTGYICRSTIVPRLFDKVAKALGRDAVHLDIGAMSQEGIRRYIFPTVKQKAFLPTETTYEYGRRMERLGRLERLDLRVVDDFVTNNLDLELLAEDWLATRRDPKELLAAYDALESITILDPTVGSGAFLLAALEVLAPLYEVALRRMDQMVRENGGVSPDVNWAGELHFEEALDQKILADPGESPVLRAMYSRLEEVAMHANGDFFIRKRILLNNLYGVDIMPEAVEICKLRLYLALISVAQNNTTLEPLPDVDLNYRSGNALVGFATLDEVHESFNPGGLSGLEFAEERLIRASVRQIREANRLQLSGEIPHELIEDIEIQRLVAVQSLNIEQARLRGLPFDQSFLRSHRPFHWMAEFPTVMLECGGFDVIVGNPPYVKATTVPYDVRGFLSGSCGDIYACCVERSLLHLLQRDGRFSMIVPISVVNTDGYSALRTLLTGSGRPLYFASFGVRPAKLFEGVDKRVTILTIGGNGPGALATNYRRWASAERIFLTDAISYQETVLSYPNVGGVAKIGTLTERRILEKLAASDRPLSTYMQRAGRQILFTRKLQYFIQFYSRPPRIWREDGSVVAPSELKHLCFAPDYCEAIQAALNSSLFFWFFICFSDCRNVNLREIRAFPFSAHRLSPSLLTALSQAGVDLEADLFRNAVEVNRNDATNGPLLIESFQPRLSKPIVDRIDCLLAEHYDFSPDELEFIVNYDLKYRMGQVGYEEGQ